MPAEMSHRRILISLKTEFASPGAGSSIVLVGCSEEGAAHSNSQNRRAAPAGCTGGALARRVVELYVTREVVLSEGAKYELISSSGESLGSIRAYGDHNNHAAYFPMGCAPGG